MKEEGEEQAEAEEEEEKEKVVVVEKEKKGNGDHCVVVGDRVRVQLISGLSVMIPGMNRGRDDFTIPAHLSVVDIIKMNQWARRPSEDDVGEDIISGWFVLLKFRSFELLRRDGLIWRRFRFYEAQIILVALSGSAPLGSVSVQGDPTRPEESLERLWTRARPRSLGAKALYSRALALRDRGVLRTARFADQTNYCTSDPGSLTLAAPRCP